MPDLAGPRRLRRRGGGVVSGLTPERIAELREKADGWQADELLALLDAYERLRAEGGGSVNPRLIRARYLRRLVRAKVITIREARVLIGLSREEPAVSAAGGPTLCGPPEEAPDA